MSTMGTDRLRHALSVRSDEAVDDSGLGARERLVDVDRRVEGLRRRRTFRRTIAASLAGAAALAAFVAAPALFPRGSGQNPDTSEIHDSLVAHPPDLAGFSVPLRLTVNEVPYEYYRSEQSPAGRDLLRVAVAAQAQPQALAWATDRNQAGRVVVSVDGNLVSRRNAGTFESGLLLSPRRTHLVVLRLTQPTDISVIGFAVYRWPRR